jgi:hypothetical protein
MTATSVATSASSTVTTGAGGGGVVGVLIMLTIDGATSDCDGTVLVLGGWA